MGVFRKPEPTEPLTELQLRQTELREQDVEIARLQHHDVFRSAVATPEQYGRVKNELELLQVQRARTLARQREIQNAIDDALRVESNREQLELSGTEEAEA